MNFWEADIIRFQQKIKEMEENPGERLECDRILFEGRINQRREQLEALNRGQPIGDIEPIGSCFFRAMGFEALDRGASAVQREGGLEGAMSPAAYKEEARALGLPVETACDQNYLLAGMVSTGDMPLEAINICHNHLCPIIVWSKFFLVHKWPHPIFHFDLPFFESETALEYLVAQYREFIEVAEKMFPGVIKYDEDKMIELLARRTAACNYNAEIYQMRKHVPCPVANEPGYGDHGDWPWGNPEYLRARRDEIAERIKRGIAAVPGEKLRVVWSGPCLHFMNPFKVLAKWGGAVIFWYGGRATPEYLAAPIPRPAYYSGRKLTPLEEEAAHALQHLYAGTGAHYVDNLLMICRDLKADAIISHQHRGASCVLGIKRMLEERAEKELGIPTLHLEASRTDPSYVSEATITAKLDEFAQMCLSRKGLA